MEKSQVLRPGAILRHNTYKIVKVLGQGGFGITYLAEDLTLDRKVAIKEFFPKDYCDRESTTSHVTLGTQSTNEFVNKLKAKFLKEARNIAKFDYPGIIKIHAAFEENNTAYYVMDYIEGSSLMDIVKRSGPIPEKHALEYIRVIGEALEYVHSHKINHLDVKPANIMVRENDDMPILIDFGLSKQYDSEGHQTSTTPTGISHGYAPMEQYNDGGVKEFSPQTDLYSLAATLYFILSGVRPPQATKLIEEGLTFPSSIPAELIDPILKAMSPARKKRHETVGKFLDELKGVENDDATEMPVNKIPVKEVSRPAPIKEEVKQEEEEKPKSKKNLIIGIVAAVVALLVIVIFVRIPGSSGSGAGPDSDTVASVYEVDGPATQEVSDMYWESPLGGAVYTGSVIEDSVGGELKKIPHGKGVAKILDGKFKGSTYEGEFKDGKMDGSSVYTLGNGDVFEGEYKNNHFSNGKYTIKETGEYFQGTFDKNGQPANGQWYDKNGNIL